MLSFVGDELRTHSAGKRLSVSLSCAIRANMQVSSQTFADRHARSTRVLVREHTKLFIVLLLFVSRAKIISLLSSEEEKNKSKRNLRVGIVA